MRISIGMSSRFRSCSRLVLVSGIALLASGCWTPVGVSHISPQAAYQLETESALSAARPSEASKTVLRRLGLLDRFEEEPAAVLRQLHDGFGSSGDEELLFALADLSFLHAERTGDRSYYLATAVYAYALLFPGEGERVHLHRSDPRLRLAYDLYNQGLAEGLTVSREAPCASQRTRNDTSMENGEVRVEAGTRTLPFGSLELAVEPSGLAWAGYPLEHFISTTALEVRGPS